MSAAETENGHTLWRAHESFINYTAGRVARSYWKVEKEDVLQELWVFLWEKEYAFISQGHSDEYVRTCIKNAADHYGKRQRHTTLLETDTFYYAVDEVKEMLPQFFGLAETWANAAVPEGYATTTKNDNVEVFCDFSLAWDRLNTTQKDVLKKKYELDEDFTDAKDRQALSRATRRFVTLLNQNKDIEAKDHTGPGSRTVITNAQGLHLASAAVDA